MHHDLQKWAWERGTNTNERVLLLVLAAYSGIDDEGNVFPCWPRMSTLMAKTLMSESTLRRTKNALIEQGLLTTEKRWKVNSYTLNYQAGSSPVNLTGENLSPVNLTGDKRIDSPSDSPDYPSLPTVEKNNHSSLQGADAPLTDKELLWAEKDWIAHRYGLGTKQIGSAIGQAVKLAGGDYTRVLEIIMKMREDPPMEFGSYLMRAVKPQTQAEVLADILAKVEAEEQAELERKYNDGTQETD